MQDKQDQRTDEGRAAEKEGYRQQEAGEAGTTRLGMEDGDNTDVSATGMGSEDDEETVPSER